MFLLLAAGYAAVSLNLIARDDIRVLSRFTLNFALPALIVMALARRPIGEILNLQYMAAVAGGSLAVFTLALAAALWLRRMPLKAAAFVALGSSVSNSGYFGYPIVLTVVGGQAAVGLALCMIVENLLMIPLALALAESGLNEKGTFRTALAVSAARLARNPLVLSILAGCALSLSGLHLPQPVFRAIEMLAAAAPPVALFVVGATLVGIKAKGLGFSVGQVVATKLIVHPAAVFGLMLLMPGVPDDLKLAGVIFASVPMLSIFSLLGERYGQERLGAAALLLATIASFVTISAWLWLLGVRPGG